MTFFYLYVYWKFPDAEISKAVSTFTTIHTVNVFVEMPKEGDCMSPNLELRLNKELASTFQTFLTFYSEIFFSR